jgi:hypothetical protein
MVELAGLLPAATIAIIEADIRRNVKELIYLGDGHRVFASGPARRDWRQCMSRLYYACYAASRALRLEVSGHFTTESSDHKNVGELPSDFPRREQFKNQLETLRGDRNLADYDHTAVEADLVIPVADAIAIAQDFLQEARNYLVTRGVTL